MHRILLTFLAVVLVLSLPDRSYAMIELLSVFFVVASAVLSVAGALLAAVLKTVILRYGVTGEARPSMLKVAAVAVWEALTLNISMLIALCSLEPVYVQAPGNKLLFFAAFLTNATVLQTFLALFPNYWLMQSTDHYSVGSNSTAHRVGMATLLSLVSPLVATAIVLGLGLSVSI